MDGEELAAAVAQVQAAHADAVNPQTSGDARPPTSDELDVLYLDKLRATLAVFGIASDVSAWKKADVPALQMPGSDSAPSRFTAQLGGTEFVFDSDRGLLYVTNDEAVPAAHDGKRYVEIHRSKDVPAHSVT